MTRRPLDGTTAPVAAVVTLLGIALASQSFVVGALVIAAVPVAFKTSWWMPGAAAIVLLAVAPLYAAIGRSDSADVLATLIELLAALSFVHLVVIQRKRTRSAGPS